MTTQVATIGQLETTRRPTLEELVDRLMEALFAIEDETTQTQTVARSVHDARRMRQTGDLDGALATFADVNTAEATERESRWAYAEWLGLVKRKFGDDKPLLYSQGTGRAAALTQRDGGTLEVVSALGMQWHPGKVISRRSLRGLRPLGGA